MIYAERTPRSAAFIGADGIMERLKRVPFMEGSFNEAWLQQLLEENPALVPASEVSSMYAPLVCIGREVPVGSGDTRGYIDNLYATPSGHLVIVETKLFRNQESRRTVVAQIIDYAKELQKWDCEHLDFVVSEYTYARTGVASRVFDLMTANGYLCSQDESSFVDRLNANLSNANFLLMIIGDGIRSSVQQLTDFLNDNTALGFNLALAELEVYEHRDGVVVIPNLLTKTTIIERLFVGQSMGLSSFRKPSAESAHESLPVGPVPSRSEYIDTFAANGGYDPAQLTELILDIEAIDGLSVAVTRTEMQVRFTTKDDASFPMLTFSISRGAHDMWVMPGRIQTFLERHGHFPFEADKFLVGYKAFVDVARCKTPPYDNMKGFYYADIDKILKDTSAFLSVCEMLTSELSYQDQY